MKMFKTFVFLSVFLFLIVIGKENCKIFADEIGYNNEMDDEEPFEYVSQVYCTLSISNGTASVYSKVSGFENTTSIGVTVYLEKLVNGSWQLYTSWTHSGGNSVENNDSTSVTHGAYRIWMSVTASDGNGSESFNVNGNTAGY